jgi:dipeptidyl aminopeptidase/acylaminoacyl peptidase
MKSLRSTGAAGLAGVLFFLAILSLARIAYRHYDTVMYDFAPWAQTELSKHPERVGIAGLEEVSFQSSDGTRLAGWYGPSRNRAAIVLTHGTNADRSSMVEETRILSEAGFGVLAFDWPGNGASEGRVRWSREERQALTAAVDWLTRRPAVDPGKLGGLGFSMGGYVMAQVAAQDPRLRAVVLVAAPTDYAQLTRWQNRKWSLLSELPAKLALYRSGMPAAEMRPIDVVHGIAPRPLLVIGGDADQVVPAFMTRALYDAAQDPKSLWIVPGASHGGYSQAMGVQYRLRLVNFFADNLLGKDRN